MASDAAWRHVHRRFAPIAFLLTVVLAAGAAVSFVSGDGMYGAVIAVAVVTVATLLIGSAWAHRGLDGDDAPQNPSLR